MRLILTLVAILMVNAGMPAAAQNDRQAARLRQDIILPFAPLSGEMSLTMGLYYIPELNYVIQREHPDLSASIQETAKTLVNEAADAPAYSHLGALYRAEGDMASARNAYRQSAEMYRLLLTRHTGDTRMIAAYNLTLLRIGRSKEAEAGLLHADKKAAEIQIALGQVREEQAEARLKGSPSPSDLNLAQTSLTDASACFSRATRLAPNSPSPWAMSAEFRAYTYPQTQARIDALRSKHPTSQEMTISPDGLSDYLCAARLSPNDPYTQAMPVWFDVVYYAVTQHAGMADARNVAKMPLEARQRARDTVSRLKGLTQAKDRRLSAQAWTALSWVQFEFYGDAPGAIHSLLQALRKNAIQQDAADYLLHVAAVTNNYPLLAALCRRELSREYSTRLHIILAYADSKIAQYDEAKDHLAIAYQQERHDVDIGLALAAMLMKTGHPADLTRTGGLFARITSGFPRTASSSQSAEYEALRGAYYALQGQPEQARPLLGLALKTDPANLQAKDMLAAIRER